METTIEDTFQDDLDDLDEEEEDEEVTVSAHNNPSATSKLQPSGNNGAGTVLEEQKLKSLTKTSDTVTSLRSSERFRKHMVAVNQLRSKPDSASDDEVYSLVIASNKLVVSINDEIARLHQVAADLFSKRFADLYSMVQEPILYMKTVQRIGNETDLTTVELGDILPSSTVMIVTVTGSTSMGPPLAKDALEKLLKGCDEALKLDEDRQNTVDFVAQNMNQIAPNVTVLLGATIAAELLSATGGLAALRNIPSGNIKVIGKSLMNTGGMAKRPNNAHNGLIFNCDLIQNAPVQFRHKVLRRLSGRVTLAARFDFEAKNRKNLSGIDAAAKGKEYRDEILNQIQKWLDPGPGKTKKALPVPDAVKKKRRGGERARRLKERFGVTEQRRDMNRTSFADMTDEYGDSAMGLTLGMLGKEGSGRLRITKKEQRNAKRKLQASASASYAHGTASVAGIATTAGTASTLAFTPLQGMELVNPELAQKKVKEANNKYFGNGFSKR